MGLVFFKVIRLVRVLGLALLLSGCGQVSSLAVEQQSERYLYRYTVYPEEIPAYEIAFYLEQAEIERQATMLKENPELEALFRSRYQAQAEAMLSEAQAGLFSQLEARLRTLTDQFNQASLPYLKFALTTDPKQRQVSYRYQTIQQPLPSQQQALVEEYRQAFDRTFAHFQTVVNQLTHSEAWQARSAALEQRLLNELNHQSYRLAAEGEQDRYYVDYARIVTDTKESLSSLALAFQSMELDPRRLLEHILPFFQSIPYSTLLPNGAGYVPPALLFANNQGDCDVKTTAMAALLKQMYPRLGVAIILIKEHAFLGVAIPRQAGDQTLVHGGQQYVLMEPTGPALLAVGRIDDTSSLAVRKRAIEKVIAL